MKADTLLISLDAKTKHMTEDERLPADCLGLLIYLLKKDNNKPFHISEVLDRFKKERSWWHRKYQILIQAGYARYERKKLSNGHVVHVYIVSDDDKSSTEYPLESNLVNHVANMQHRKTEQFANPQEVEGPYPERYEVANMQHKRKEEEKNIDHYMRPRARQAHKFYDPLTHTPEQLKLAQYYLDMDFPIIRKNKDWRTANQPGIKHWAEITGQPVRWEVAAAINATLGGQPNARALTTAWDQWLLCGYKPTNVKGILSWYKQLNSEPNSRPWEWQRGKNGTGHNTSRESKKEHGLAPDDAEVTYVYADEPEWWNEEKWGAFRSGDTKPDNAAG